ncbi:hypothetical protein ACET3X_006500 [Alternaria dauci]|uniref:SMP domain-containing protein n=1 Tax=Alternaria dauci TaxID=48095 RepID=A0ABR3UFT2_9PLEO
MSDILSEKTTSDVSTDATTASQRFQDQLESVLKKLKSDPCSITADEARILTENVAIRDGRAGPSHDQAPHRSLLMAAKDLHAAVDGSSEEATIEVLRIAQSIVSKLQKAVGHTNAPHPEVEAELQKEIAKIEPKIAQGTVTKAEADHLHSLEARAHGHTERGGIAAAAQSVAARRERQLSLSSGSGTVSSPIGGRSHANSRNFTSPQQQPVQERLNEFHHADMATRLKTETETETTTKPGTGQPQPVEVRTIHGIVESDGSAKHGSVASSGRSRANSKSVTSPGGQSRQNKNENLRDTAQSFISRRRQESLSDVSNSSATEHRKEHSKLDKDLQKVDEELENGGNKAHKKPLVNKGRGCTNECDHSQLEDGEICDECDYIN